FVHQDLLGIQSSTNGLIYALVGGVNTIVGPLLGAVALRYVTDLLSRGSTQSSLYLGIVLMLVVYLMPDGILGLRQQYGPRRKQAMGTESGAAAPSVEATAESVEASR